MAAYSFLDTMAAISGPGGAFTLSPGGGIAEEGITITMTEDKATMTVGADGGVMHSLHAGKSGQLTVRLLKTSPTNALLTTLYTLQTTSARLYGLNVITVNDLARGDNITARAAGFLRMPAINYAKEGGAIEWVFNCGQIDFILGPGLLANAA